MVESREPGARWVHIGPHQTGANDVRRALDQGASVLRDHALAYVGRDADAAAAAPTTTATILSSDALAGASPGEIEALRERLGGDRLQVVRAVRRYDRLVPLIWQQQVAAGRTRAYETFVDQVVNDSGSGFWYRQGVLDLTRRWADIVGPERVTVVLYDEQEPSPIASFETVLGLPPGSLGRRPARRTPSWSASSVLVAVNRLADSAGVADRLTPAMRRSLVAALGSGVSSPPPDLPPDIAATLDERFAADLAALPGLGVRVIGDPDAVLGAPPPETSEAPISVGVSSLVAATATLPQGAPGAEVAIPEEPSRPDEVDVDPAALAAAVPSADAIDVVATHAEAAPDVEDLIAIGEAQGRIVTEFTRDAADWVVVHLVPWDALVLAGWQDELLGGGSVGFEEWQRSWLAVDGPTETVQLLDAERERLGADRLRVAVVDPRVRGAVRRSLGSALGVRPAYGGARRVLAHPELEFLAGVDPSRRARCFAWLAAGAAAPGLVPVLPESRAALEAAEAALVGSGLTIPQNRGLGRLRDTGLEARVDPASAARAIVGSLDTGP